MTAVNLTKRQPQISNERSDMSNVMTLEKDIIKVPKRIALRTRKGSSKNVAFAGNGVTIRPDLRSSMPVIYSVPCKLLIRTSQEHNAGKH